jgi:F0F1-type ATP synthase membrane subunit c/vacuolar-type H+-ATPase subunit K
MRTTKVINVVLLESIAIIGVVVVILPQMRGAGF